MLAGFLAIGVSYKLFDFTMFLFVAVLLFGISGTFAFFKVNGMPFHFFVLNFVQTLRKPGLRVWNSGQGQPDVQIEAVEKNVIKEHTPARPKLFTTSRLSELSLIVDTRGSYKGEEEQNGGFIDKNQSGSGDTVKK